MKFDSVRKIADAVLFEGYALYPYRASAPKNRYRWTFGVLAPRDWSEAGGCERWWLESQCLLEPRTGAALHVRLRFLRPRRRRVEEKRGDAFVEAAKLERDGELILPWDEAVVCERDVRAAPGGRALDVPFAVRSVREIETVRGGDGAEIGRMIRDSAHICGRIRVDFTEVAADRPLLRVRVRVDNLTPWQRPGAPRDEILPASLVGTHLLFAASDGAFISLLDPPAWAAEAAAACENVGTYPVLAGPAGRRDLLLSAPIILYDHPQVAPESQGDFFDATEIDELLTLRTLTLTDEEKRQARATDARAAELVGRVCDAPPEALDRLHGAIRDLHRGEMTPREGAGAKTARAALPAVGTRVRLRPGKRRTDAQDLLFAGQIATVEAVVHDVDGRDYLAVTIDGDPAAELHRWYGRFHYYEPDEVEVLAADAEER